MAESKTYQNMKMEKLRPKIGLLNNIRTEELNALNNQTIGELNPRVE